jgi:enterochelin esterase-like enzyme
MQSKQNALDFRPLGEWNHDFCLSFIIIGHDSWIEVGLKGDLLKEARTMSDGSRWGFERSILTFIVIVFCSMLQAGCVEETEVILAPDTPEPTPSHTASPEFTPIAFLTPTPTPTPLPQCEAKSGFIEKGQYPGFLVDGEVPYWIYLPPCYEEQAIRYPVLYVFHGYPMDESHWSELGIVEVVEQGILSGSWEPFLVVMPRIPDPLNTGSDGGSSSYEEEMLSGLLPYIEGQYRTIGVRTAHAIAGVSRGGVWALEIGLRNADLFNIVAALSPALHVNRARPPYDPFRFLPTLDETPEYIFLSAAENEGGFRTKTEELSQLMEDLRIQHTFLLTPGVHEDATWQAIMGDFVSFIISGWGTSLIDR